MSMVRTASNRANAQKSTGPKTARGKATSSQNARKHGILTREVILAGESRSEFASFRKGMLQSLTPVGELEFFLVDRVVSSAWRLRRVLKAESAALDFEHQEHGSRTYTNGTVEWTESVSDREAWRDIGRDFLLHYGTDPIANLTRYEAALERGMYRALHEIQRLQAERSGRATVAPSVLDLTVSAGE